MKRYAPRIVEVRATRWTSPAELEEIIKFLNEEYSPNENAWHLHDHEGDTWNDRVEGWGDFDLVSAESLCAGHNDEMELNPGQWFIARSRDGQHYEIFTMSHVNFIARYKESTR